MRPAAPPFICGETKGRALLIDRAGRLYIARGYRILRSDDGGATWKLDAWVPTSPWNHAVLRVSLATRLLRVNLQALQVLPDGTRVVVARDGIYRAGPGERRMTRSWAVSRGSRPITLSLDGTRLLFGEYGGGEMNRVGVRVYASEDGGRRFEPLFELPKGDVHHIHQVLVDPYADHYWILAGDHGREPGIAALSKDGRNLTWVDRGHQMVRAVSALPRPDALIYGSDSEVEPNFIIRLDRKTGRWDRLRPTEGSSLFAADVAGVSLISTSYETSPVMTTRRCPLYASIDDVTWEPILSLKKDFWHPYLHLGLVVLPTVQDRSARRWMFSGQAVTGHHDLVSLCDPPLA